MVNRSLDFVVGQINCATLRRHCALAGNGGLVEGGVALGDARRPGRLVASLGGTGDAGIMAGAANRIENGRAILRPGGSGRGSLGQFEPATGWMRLSAWSALLPASAADFSPFMEKGTTTAVRTMATMMVATMMPLEEYCSAMLITSIRKNIRAQL